MVSVTSTTEPTFRETGRQRLFDVTEHFTGVAAESHHYDVSADGQRFTMVRLLELPEAARQQIVVSFDFLNELEALAESN
jgi:hypothetical protein